MRYDIEYSRIALSDLDDLKNYISDNLKNPVAAKNTTKAILDKIEQIALFPNSGTILAAAPNFKYTVSRNYIIVYRISEQKVHIVRVIYAKRDWRNILLK